MEEIEIWKPIEGFPNYEVSNFGRIINNKSGRILCENPKHENRYRVVFLNHNGEIMGTGIHRLVALAFIPNPQNKPVVNHKDGVKYNNHHSNLEWATHSENSLHSAHVLHPRPKKKVIASIVEGEDEIARIKREGREAIKKYWENNKRYHEIGVMYRRFYTHNRKRKIATT